MKKEAYCIWGEAGQKDGRKYTHGQYFVEDDGGRADAGFKGETGDCACRAIAIATESPYQVVYDLINEFAKAEKPSKTRRGISSAREGVHKHTFKKIMEHLGWEWVATMFIGSGCKVHLRGDELPDGNIICLASKHYVAVIDGVIHDIHDSSRGGERCVYGYYKKD